MTDKIAIKQVPTVQIVRRWHNIDAERTVVWIPEVGAEGKADEFVGNIRSAVNARHAHNSIISS